MDRYINRFGDIIAEIDSRIKYILLRIKNLIANFNTDGSSELAWAKICRATINQNEVILWASGYYFGCLGLREVFRVSF